MSMQSILSGKLAASTEKLENYPMIGRLVPELAELGLREVIFQGYRIVYRLNQKEQAVEILAVVHAARDIERISKDEWEL